MTPDRNLLESPRRRPRPAAAAPLAARLLALALPALTLSALTVAAAPASADPIGEMLEAKQLAGAFNPVLLDYLLEEGRDRLAEPRRTQAVDQLVTALKSEIEIEPGEQRAAALAAAAGALAAALGDGVAAEGGAAAYGASYQIWSSWVDAAFVLERAGYGAETARFFEKCIAEFPFLELRGRCAVGLARAQPGRAFEITMGLLEEPSAEVVDAALRLLGDLAASDAVTAEQRQRILDAQVAHTQGLKKASHGAAALEGMVRSGNPKAVPVLQGFTTGMMNRDFIPIARRGLLLTFGDRSVVPLLEKTATGGGLMDTTEPWEKLRAGALLIEAGADAGYAWAREQLTKKRKKGFAKKLSLSSDEPDLRPRVVEVLVAHGDERAIEVLRQAVTEPGSWLETSVAVGLLELGDGSRAALAKRAFDNPDWGFTQVRLALALAGTGDLSGIAPLASLYRTAEQGPHAASGRKVLGLLAGRSSGAGDQEATLTRLRIRIARALGEIDRAEAVAPLTGILDDGDPTVAATAAYALAGMSVAESLDGMAKALGRGYGSAGDRPRDPLVWATVVRGAARFAGEDGARAVFTTAAGSGVPAVEFLALVAGAPG